ncbi:MAG: sporulation protein YqfD [Clostridia bacterium]|nr:sporulation protein YqfD [Clostridia bacterium]
MTFLWSWLRWLFGYAVLEIQGAYGERFITLCMKNEIDLWEIRRVCPGIIRVKTFLFSKKRFDVLARKSGVTLEYKEEIGLPVTLKRYRLRIGLFLGIGLYLLLLLLFSRIVWSVEIPNVNPVQEKRIRSVLLDEGFGIGSFIPWVDYKNLRYQLMLKEDDISFVSVNMNGCRAMVEVRFSETAPPSVDDGTPCNIVASRDGQIVSMLVQTGMRYAKKGQTVQKGDLLVGGIMDTRLGYYVVHAKAKILARVTDVQSQTESLTRRISQRTGRRVIRREWRFFDKTVNATPWFSCPYDEYDVVTETKYLSFGDGENVPIALTETYYYETYSQEESITPEEAEELARARLDEIDRLRFYGVEVESVNETVSVTDRSVTVTRVRSVITDICEDKTFYFED